MINKRNYDSWFEERIHEKLNESSHSAVKRGYSVLTETSENNMTAALQQQT